MRHTAGRLGRMAAALGVMMWMMGMTAAAENASVIQIGTPPPGTGSAGSAEGTENRGAESVSQSAKGPGADQEGPAGFGPGRQAVSNSLGIDVSQLPSSGNTDQLVVAVWAGEKSGADAATAESADVSAVGNTQPVTGTGEGGAGTTKSSVRVAYFRRQENGAWNEVFCVPGFCGYNGVSWEKKEGDRQTPAGTFGFVKAFGILPNPGSHFSYKQLDSSDYWVDDSSSRYYNQMVSTNEVVPDWNSAENLSQIAPSYHYVLALDYNTAERVPGKGSAIFLHGYHTWKTWTEGCVAIPEENMKQLVQELKPDARMVILPSLP